MESAAESGLGLGHNLAAYGVCSVPREMAESLASLRKFLAQKPETLKTGWGERLWLFSKVELQSPDTSNSKKWSRSGVISALTIRESEVAFFG